MGPSLVLARAPLTLPASNSADLLGAPRKRRGAAAERMRQIRKGRGAASVPRDGAPRGATCGRCQRLIDGVCLFDAGLPVHFGCASEGLQARSTGLCLDSGSELARVLFEFRLASEVGRSLYPFNLQIERAFALSSEAQRDRFQEALGQLQSREEGANVRRLYHGTSCASAKAIVASGFQEPTTSGMFGRSIYFADLPNKSWQYSNDRYMLVCDVALGRSKMLGRANTSGQRLADEFDSIIGCPTQNGDLRVTEYAIFRPAQVLPKFLLWLRET